MKTVKEPIYSSPTITIMTLNILIIKYFFIAIKSCTITLSISIGIWNPRKFSNSYSITKFTFIVSTITSRFFAYTINSMTIKFTTSTNICYKTNSSSWHIVRTIRCIIYKLKSINSVIFYYYSKICSNIKITIVIISSTIFIMFIYSFPHRSSSRHESRKFKMNCSMFTTTQMKTC